VNGAFNGRFGQEHISRDRLNGDELAEVLGF